MNAAPPQPGQLLSVEPPPTVQPRAVISSQPQTNIHNTYFKAIEQDESSWGTNLLKLVVAGGLILALISAYAYVAGLPDFRL
jgi:hypothetical protein